MKTLFELLVCFCWFKSTLANRIHGWPQCQSGDPPGYMIKDWETDRNKELGTVKQQPYKLQMWMFKKNVYYEISHSLKSFI